MFVDGSDIFLKDDLLRWCRADHFSEPPEMGRAPIGPADVADIVSEQESFESKLGVLKMAESIFTCPSAVSYGFIFHCGDIPGNEITRAPQPRQLNRVTTVGFDPVAGCLGNHGRSDDSADMACLRQIARQPVPTRSRFIDKDQGLGV